MPPALTYRFGAFELRTGPRALLLRDGAPVVVPDRHLTILSLLLAHAGDVVTRDAVMTAGWNDLVVAPNSVDKVISDLRAVFGGSSDGPQIEALRKRGFRFTTTVTREETDGDPAGTALATSLRRWIEGRAALETLHLEQVRRARAAFEDAVRAAPHHAIAHLGLANACIMQFEATRADAAPDRAALLAAVHHAETARRLEPESGEAWATLGFVLARTEAPVDALAASKHATTIERGNWRHEIRLASVASGEERLAAARRTLIRMPGFPFAHLLAATVFIARQTLSEAEREVLLGIAGHDAQVAAGVPFSGIALHWCHGLIRLAEGDEAGAEAAFQRELSFERHGHLYARECGAHTWHAIGAMRLRAGDTASAVEAFEAALARVPAHPLAQAGLRIAKRRLADRGGSPEVLSAPPAGTSVDLALGRAALLVSDGLSHEAAAVVEAALDAAGPGSAGWVLPIEPLLNVAQSPAAWKVALAKLKGRAG